MFKWLAIGLGIKVSLTIGILIIYAITWVITRIFLQKRQKRWVEAKFFVVWVRNEKWLESRILQILRQPGDEFEWGFELSERQIQRLFREIDADFCQAGV